MALYEWMAVIFWNDPFSQHPEVKAGVARLLNLQEHIRRPMPDGLLVVGCLGFLTWTMSGPNSKYPQYTPPSPAMGCQILTEGPVR